MGGKNKQRTKGNLRPSSSGRAAELLAKERGTVPGFIGFGTSQSDLGYVPAVQGADEIDSLVDSDFRMVLRKLSKKDVTTKLKAMQEFGTMCDIRDAEIVKGVLPYWPRIYCKISLDYDRRVREATQIAFEKLVLKVKKHLAPHLKSLMGYWLIAQCDTFAPAAIAAKIAFEAAFPPSKQSEALVFCKDEIINVLQDHLLKETADTLSDPQTVAEEEREAKYFRILTSSLLALKKLLCMLPPSEISSVELKLKPLLSHNKFWKYGKHSSSQVRSAFFELVSAFCQYIPQSVKAESSKISPAVLVNIDESDPIVCPPLWEAVLYILTTIEDCWNHVNAKKNVFPKLSTILIEGGRGLATVIYPYLLPFISKIPTSATDLNLEFFKNFFSYITKGLSTERILANHSERSAVVSAFFECLRFIMQQHLGIKEESVKMQKMLINDQLIPFVDTALRDPRLQNEQLFDQLAETLNSWETKAETQGDDTVVETLKNVLKTFWTSLSEICLEKINAQETDGKSLLGISTLLEVLQKAENSWKQRKRKVCKIKYITEVPESSTENKKEENKTDSCEEEDGEDSEFCWDEALPVPVSHLRKGPLYDLVCKLAEQSIEHIGELKSEQHLSFLSSLLKSFSSCQIFQALLDLAEEKNASNRDFIPLPQEIVKPLRDNPAIQFMYQRLLNWLGEDKKQNTDFLVDILYSILCCCETNSERKTILDDLTKLDLKWNILLRIIQKACSSPDKHLLVSIWLKGDILGEKLVTLADHLCNMDLEVAVSSESSTSEGWTLLSLVLSQRIKNGMFIDYLIGESYVERIIGKLNAALSKAKNISEVRNTESPISFICDVASSFFISMKGCCLMPSSEELLLTIFQLCAQNQDFTHLSDFLVCKLKHTWLCGLRSLVLQFGNADKQSTFLRLSALWLKDQIQSSSLDVKSLRVMISTVDDLLNNLLEASNSPFLLRLYVENLMPNDSEWEHLRHSLSTQWLHKPLLEGRLSLNYEHSRTDFQEHSTVKLPSHLCTTALLSKIVLLSLKEEIILEDNKTEKIIAELLYSLQWCEELENPYSMLTEFREMLQEMGITYDNLCVLSKIPGLLQLMFIRSRDSGTLWALTLSKLMRSKNILPDEVKRLYKTTEGFFPVTEGSLHTVQSLSSFLPLEDKEELVNQCTARLLTCTKKDLCNIDGSFGYLSILNSCLKKGSIDGREKLYGILKIIMSWKSDHEDIFLFSCNLKEASPQLLGLNIEIIHLLSILLKYSSSLLVDTDWDFIMCSMLAWLETTSENHVLYPVPLVQLFACVSCDLACTLSAYFNSISSNLPVNLISEWHEFFSEGIHNLLLPLLVKITEENKDTSETSFQNSVLIPLGETLTYISKDQLLNHNLAIRLTPDQKTNLPERLQTLLNTLAPLLHFRARPVQIAVYHVLYKLMPELPRFDDDDVKSYVDEEEEPVLSPPAALMTVLGILEDLLENILECYPVGEFAVIQPLSEEFCYVLGYLLTWKLILTFFKAATSQLRALYSLYLRRTKSLNKLLYHLFRLMPEVPTMGLAGEVPNKETKTFFTEELHLHVRETATLSSQIPHLACSVYQITLKDLPAMVRLWWNSCEKRVFNVVDKFTSKYVSNMLSFQEISSVQTSTQLFNGMTVKARSTTREVIATYSVDDIFIELIIQLPLNYPLGSITVESGKRVGVAVQQWRNWMLQLSTYLTHQNGSIMEGLALWKNNVDKRFEGVEDCMICFSVIHGFNYSLPKKACRTCKKKFHSACLYKWFTSSNKSTCPLCRETFF
ncbi:E3 ubiquitin-protein ligase listerin isoform X1 [Sarcophilus harrisii]|uniref:E3 ubiquitin-protein ligase listerin isoform X1 n=1 Tax=Sarcophilus harrisii TaxID=9305 RepID=UPI001301C921|nr:E3 ubiquitin-protein ligase listerin isoform X1 [Sarcophilus harrisii]